MPLNSGGAPLTIVNGLREFAEATPENIAVIDGDRRLTFAELWERSQRLARQLNAFGLAHGDRVGVLLGNRLEYPEIAAGIASAGLVMVPLNPRLTTAEAEYILSHSETKALILDDALSAIVAEPVASAGLPCLSIEGTQLGADYEAALASAPTLELKVDIDENDAFCITYTSGTTGRPKGVVISHRSRSLTFTMSALEWGLSAGRISAAVAPMYHGAGFAFGYAPVYTGGTVTMLRKWDPSAFLELVQRDKVQSAFLVPTMAQAMRSLGDQVVDSYDLSSLDTLYFNAAALPWALKQWVMERFPAVGVHELYGSTESGIITNLRPVHMRARPGSVGHAWFHTEIRILDDEGNPVPHGTAGELFSRSPYLMNGYLNDPEATEACTTPDGFVTCGDIAVRDAEGFISIVDRKKDLIISGGTNVYPREIEEVLATHPQVVESAVVGEVDETWGETVVAHVVMTIRADQPAAMADEIAEQLAEHCRTSLAGYKIPRRWYVTPALPRNAGGKVVKRELAPPVKN